MYSCEWLKAYIHWKMQKTSLYLKSAQLTVPPTWLFQQNHRIHVKQHEILCHIQIPGCCQKRQVWNKCWQCLRMSPRICVLLISSTEHVHQSQKPTNSRRAFTVLMVLILLTYTAGIGNEDLLTALACQPLQLIIHIAAQEDWIHLATQVNESVRRRWGEGEEMGTTDRANQAFEGHTQIENWYQHTPTLWHCTVRVKKKNKPVATNSFSNLFERIHCNFPD